MEIFILCDFHLSQLCSPALWLAVAAPRRPARLRWRLFGQRPRGARQHRHRVAVLRQPGHLSAGRLRDCGALESEPGDGSYDLYRRVPRESCPRPHGPVTAHT